MSSGKPLDISRFSGSRLEVLENKGIKGFFSLDSGFRRNDEGGEWLCSTLSPVRWAQEPSHP